MYTFANQVNASIAKNPEAEAEQLYHMWSIIVVVCARLSESKDGFWQLGSFLLAANHHKSTTRK